GRPSGGAVDGGGAGEGGGALALCAGGAIHRAGRRGSDAVPDAVADAARRHAAPDAERERLRGRDRGRVRLGGRIQPCLQEGGRRSTRRLARGPEPGGRVRSSESGREDLNLRPPAPKAGALPGCATPRVGRRREHEDVHGVNSLAKGICAGAWSPTCATVWVRDDP